ncbi:hypothetical protein FPZ12_038840 [Amycolatopsis acidicola]|uniref:Uncharacterized protein n=1 Tax=Amycolatopsis acidicola TaxID=2596893 RepID=A0A5N0UMN1_9PSEU|nr:hypothetical protein [Amycolatopsis acidicola]KAA9151563.1 hypothetical protein FPZ12_038840 [Amycolatopsis acidicola]
MDGKAHLEDLIATRLDADALSWREILQVSHDLIASGALDPAEAGEILEEVRERLVREGKLKVRRVSASASVRHTAKAVRRAGPAPAGDGPSPKSP